ncbi:hypothetical protein V8C43DRAFT_89421 [Trichoderma afarasin]
MVYLTPLHIWSLSFVLFLMRADLILLRLLPLYIDLFLLCLCVCLFACFIYQDLGQGGAERAYGTP